jgi:hypothetical protein
LRPSCESATSFWHSYSTSARYNNVKKLIAFKFFYVLLKHVFDTNEYNLRER